MALTLLLAWAIEVTVGWPDALYRRIRHPVVWIGWLITAFDNALNSEHLPRAWRTVAGGLTTAIVVATAWIITSLIVSWLPSGAVGTLGQALLAATLLASRSLFTHVAAVATALATESITAARRAVAAIVGRDPDQLDEAGIARASIESLAENASDGVIAPLFWGALFGIPGIAAYKAINTLDSMIGHRNTRYEYFGKVAARLDDAANWLPARLTGALFTLAAFDRSNAWQVMCRDAHQHRSINAGWPEAAMAGALGVRLSGPRHYGDTVNSEPWLNTDAPDPSTTTIDTALGTYVRAMLYAALLLLVVAVAERVR
ncbi:MAG: adenosylcobinamide-phosphate synthase CbiB [Pseudomonadota bacterium]